MRRMALIVVLSALLASSVSAAAADHELKLIPSIRIQAHSTRG